MRHDINRIGGDDDHSVGRVVDDLWNDLPKHGGIAFQQLQACFSGLLIYTRRHDHHAAATQVGICAVVDVHGMGKGNRVVKVVGFRFRPFGVLVHQHDLATDAAHQQRIGGGRTDEAAPHNAYFHDHFSPVIMRFGNATRIVI